MLPGLILQQGNQLMGLLPMVGMVAILYFLLILPMQRQKKQHAKMLSELKPGDTVQTNGGIIGSVFEIREDDTLILRVRPDNVKLQLARAAVASVQSDGTKS
ncbi:MAG: preprotein translocase subunit YajC [Acidobacteria bacterium]|nr:preprotein translocase subunit YajC [Acidobacteriota bacterium]